LNVLLEATREAIAQLSGKLQRLLDSYLDGDVERELYQDKRAEILEQQEAFEEKIEQATLGVLTWVEPMKDGLSEPFLSVKSQRVMIYPPKSRFVSKSSGRT
jgi:hypothetical protein